MKALLLHDLLPDDPADLRLRAAGHEVVRCRPATDRRPFPCTGATGGPCPLDGTVDVAVVVHDRPTSALATGELGAVCALRDGIPIVIAGNGAHSPLREVAAAVAGSMDDVVPACERAVQARERRLGRLAGGEVRVRGDRVQVTLPAGATSLDVTRAHRVLTAALPHARTIDVAVEPAAS